MFEGNVMYPLFNWVLVAFGVLMGSFGSLFMKWGAIKMPQDLNGNIFSLIYNILINPLLMLGIILYAIPTAIWIWLLRTMPLTLLQPALSLTYVISALLAVFLLHEHVSVLRWVGIFVIIFGVILVAQN
ncbi:EamA family transporter [Citrobacter sp. RHBSTW-00271]|uniref:EamA family transporter n=1 Tax=Citrobacter sp. RHBSTW-00271 TaxID=2742642 RepID=UPI0015FDEA2B|nr:EamA family transporter [Citrobacter sp. RHBSTW-00271]MBA7944158.1 EamA family transporter [Citrobacter sp. RHBSTW-00271]